jgi:hypothetical protein
VDTSLHSVGSSLANVLIAGSASSGSSSPAPAPAPTGSDEGPGGVTWTHLRNVSVEQERLRKTGGCFGCPDATAVSAETIDGAGGFIEFRASADGLNVVGLTTRTTPALRDFDAALRFDRGLVEVRERGSNRGETNFVDGDVFRISLTDGRIVYTKNGVEFRSSNARNIGSPRAGALLYLTNGSIYTPIIDR